ncbi:GNAT family N-acetyltransferase [Brucella sp. TWI559]
MMTNLIARPYTVSDFNGCLAIFDSNVPTFFAAGEREEFCDFLIGKSGVEGFYLVLTLNEDIIACGGLTIDAKKRQASLSWGMVSSEMHRKGIGTYLFKARLEQARHLQNIDELVLSTSQHSSGFYERLGFRVSKIMPNGFGPGLDCWDMTLRWATN